MVVVGSNDPPLLSGPAVCGNRSNMIRQTVFGRTSLFWMTAMAAISMAMWADRLAREMVLHLSGTLWTSSDPLSWTSSDPSSRDADRGAGRCCCGAIRTKNWNYISSRRNPQCGCCWNTLRTNFLVVPTRYPIAMPRGSRRNLAPDLFDIQTRNDPRHCYSCCRCTHRRSSERGFLVSERDRRS